MKASAARDTRAGEERGSQGEAGAARLRVLADLSRTLRGVRRERGIWEAALDCAGHVYAAAQAWALDPQGRVLLGPADPLPAGASSGMARPLGTGPQVAPQVAEGGALLRVPVWAGEAWLGLLVLRGRDGGCAPEPDDLLTLEVLAAQAGAALQLLRLTAARAGAVGEGPRDQAGGPGMGDRGGARLTAREREVLTLVARGLSNPEIGAALGIRAGTAKIHVERILSKLGVPDRAGAAALGLSLGLIEG